MNMIPVSALLFFCACEKIEETSVVGNSDHVIQSTTEPVLSDHDGFFTLSLEDGPNENTEYGVRLLAVGPNFATIFSTNDNTVDTAYIGEHFDGGSFGRIGLLLVRTDPELKAALMKRTVPH